MEKQYNMGGGGFCNSQRELRINVTNNSQHRQRAQESISSKDFRQDQLFFALFEQIEQDGLNCIREGANKSSIVGVYIQVNGLPVKVLQQKSPLPL